MQICSQGLTPGKIVNTYPIENSSLALNRVLVRTFHLYTQLHQRMSASKAYYTTTEKEFYLTLDNFTKQQKDHN